MAITTTSNTAFIEAQQYSQFILETLKDGLLPTNFYRNVSDFGMGTTLNIKTIGKATIQEVTENEDITFNPIETGNVTLQMTDHIGDGWYVTDDMREDGNQIEALTAQRGLEATRAIQEHFETRFLATMNAGQTDDAPNAVNGFNHRVRATGGNEQMLEVDLINMRLAFDKANVPMSGRVAIVDPVVAATFAKTSTLTTYLNNGGALGGLSETLVKDGFDQEHQFVTMLHGWQIWTSNRLPQLAAGAGVDGTVSITAAGVANIFMCIADDGVKPGMVAWRRAPRVESERNISKRRDEFAQSARWGMGVQRVDTLGIIVSDAVATA
jgi:hypothetical protein